jgi:hypothetical protein
MSNQVLVLISEEYGFQRWFAVYNRRVLEQVKNRWQTMKNLGCLVPVPLIFPGAKQYCDDHPPICAAERETMQVFHAHVHESDDSGFDACPKFNIPENGGDFEINDKTFTHDEIVALRDQEMEKSREYLRQTYPEYFAPAEGAESEVGS